MNYEDFRKVPYFEKMNPQMKIIAAIYLNDKEDKGLTREQLKAVLKDDIEQGELEINLEAMELIAETIEPTAKKIEEKYTQAFRLSEDMRTETERFLRALSSFGLFR